MSLASQLSRYRPAVLAITGVAAACGIYVLYTTYSDRPAKSGLRRSGAIRGPRGDRQTRPTVEYLRPNDAAPLGYVVVRRGLRDSHTINIDTEAIPTMDQLGVRIGPAQDPFVRDEIDVAAAESILQACYLPRSDVELNNLAALGLEDLPQVLVERDVGAIQVTAIAEISRVLPSVRVERIKQAVENFVNSDLFLSGQTNSDDDQMYAETELVDGPDGAAPEPSQGLKGLLYHIAESEAKRKAYVHRGINCEECGDAPIRGVRWHCLNCPNYDLCSTCEEIAMHPKTHVFVKIKIPLPVLSQPTKEYPLWYPGDPRKHHGSLGMGLKNRLQGETGFEATEIDALYDQFTCLANVPWPNDPNGVRAAMDRRAFNKALTSERWAQRFRPNAIYDRTFAFYDTDSNGLIGFAEFIGGMAYLRGPRRFASLHRALQAFDLDGDGFVDRQDFIRLFRAKHEIQKLLISDMIEGRESEQTRAAMDTLRSSQPISSVFSQEEIPQGESRPPTGKVVDRYGDMQPMPGTKTILENHEGLQPCGNLSDLRPPHQRLQRDLARAGDMLDGSMDEVDDQQRTAAQTNGVSSPQVNLELPVISRQHPQNHSPEPQHGEDADGPLDQDLLWRIIDHGYHELLDPLFSAKETEHMKVVNTREERQKWKKEIEAAAKESTRREAQFKNELRSGAMVDPLIATAMSNISNWQAPRASRSTQSNLEESFSHDRASIPEMVPTDPETLARREAEIAEQPLEQLLDMTGYEVIDEDGNRNRTDGGDVERSASPDSARLRGILEPGSGGRRQPHTENGALANASAAGLDVTMPQNRPNALPPGIYTTREVSASTPATPRDIHERNSEDSQAPSTALLEMYAALDEQDRELKLRGGVGRLSYEEVEELVNADSTKELRGLVISWLDWAS